MLVEINSGLDDKQHSPEIGNLIQNSLDKQSHYYSENPKESPNDELLGSTACKN